MQIKKLVSLNYINKKTDFLSSNILSELNKAVQFPIFTIDKNPKLNKWSF